MQCPECHYDNEADRDVCDLCGTQLPERDLEHTADVKHGADEDPSGPGATNTVGGRTYRKKGRRDDRKSTSERFSERRATQLFRYHPMAGAGILFALMTITNFPGSLGVPDLFMNLVASILVGAPMGFLISYIGGGFFVGALISMGVYAGVDLLLLLMHGAIDSILVVPILMQTFMWGWIPGSLIGVHVNQDQV